MYTVEMVVEAKKRCLLKRYLAKKQIPFDVNASTIVLRTQVRQSKRLLTPSLEDIRNMVRNKSPYILALVCCKIMWGPKATVGYVDVDGTIHEFSTITEMAEAGFTSKKWIYLDRWLRG